MIKAEALDETRAFSVSFVKGLFYIVTTMRYVV